MFDLNTLLLFVKVVELGSFSDASRELNTPKSTISRKISQLEEHLDVRLLQRNTRQVQLTEVGRQIYDRSVRILKEALQVSTTAENSRQEVAGNLKIIAPISFNPETLTNLCAGFMQNYSKVDIDLQFSDGDVDLLGHNADIAIKFGPLSDSNLIAKLLFERERVLVASREYIQQHGQPTDLESLKSHDGLILGNSRAMPLWPFGSGENRHLVSIKPRYRVNSSASLKQMAKAGLGIAMLTRTDCEAALKAGSLVQLLPEIPIEPIKCYGLYTSRMQLAPKISHFLDYVVRHANEQRGGLPKLSLVES
ncbi:LysR family transcriptional regulator [Pseudomaricurvus sp. HS19]|uniref:LysR family transcriptional regulator n=1 Tax=Pseudomaricurvus sp. HS19 TaxID=2692626 RepID=UPI0013691248|nr:LysR family transcriptional regulator [Pseudomaricurvus sp. HS19]MYM61828.1 LysR family transcriptional regulator [Pseudomaricurvus sp. HS19]